MKTLVTFVAACVFAGITTPSFAGGDAERGKAVAEKGACASCHGADFSNPTDPSYPRLAGQHADYLAQALKGYKNPNNPAVGRVNAIMNGFAGQLSAQDIDDLAAYFSSLPSKLVTQR